MPPQGSRAQMLLLLVLLPFILGSGEFLTETSPSGYNLELLRVTLSAFSSNPLNNTFNCTDWNAIYISGQPYNFFCSGELGTSRTSNYSMTAYITDQEAVRPLSSLYYKNLPYNMTLYGYSNYLNGFLHLSGEVNQVTDYYEWNGAYFVTFDYVQSTAVITCNFVCENTTNSCDTTTPTSSPSTPTTITTTPNTTTSPTTTVTATTAGKTTTFNTTTASTTIQTTTYETTTPTLTTPTTAAITNVTTAGTTTILATTPYVTTLESTTTFNTTTAQTTTTYETTLNTTAVSTTTSTTQTTTGLGNSTNATTAASTTFRTTAIITNATEPTTTRSTTIPTTIRPNTTTFTNTTTTTPTRNTTIAFKTTTMITTSQTGRTTTEDENETETTSGSSSTMLTTPVSTTEMTTEPGTTTSEPITCGICPTMSCPTCDFVSPDSNNTSPLEVYVYDTKPYKGTLAVAIVEGIFLALLVVAVICLVFWSKCAGLRRVLANYAIRDMPDNPLPVYPAPSRRSTSTHAKSETVHFFGAAKVPMNQEVRPAGRLKEDSHGEEKRLFEMAVKLSFTSAISISQDYGSREDKKKKKKAPPPPVDNTLGKSPDGIQKISEAEKTDSLTTPTDNKSTADQYPEISKSTSSNLTNENSKKEPNPVSQPPSPLSSNNDNDVIYAVPITKTPWSSDPYKNKIPPLHPSICTTSTLVSAAPPDSGNTSKNQPLNSVTNEQDSRSDQEENEATEVLSQSEGISACNFDEFPSTLQSDIYETIPSISGFALDHLTGNTYEVPQKREDLPIAPSPPPSPPPSKKEREQLPEVKAEDPAENYYETPISLFIAGSLPEAPIHEEEEEKEPLSPSRTQKEPVEESPEVPLKNKERDDILRALDLVGDNQLTGKVVSWTLGKKPIVRQDRALSASDIPSTFEKPSKEAKNDWLEDKDIPIRLLKKFRAEAARLSKLQRPNDDYETISTSTPVPRSLTPLRPRVPFVIEIEPETPPVDSNHTDVTDFEVDRLITPPVHDDVANVLIQIGHSEHV